MSGIGVDIVQIPRIEKIFKEYGVVFAKKILGIHELKKFLMLANHHKSNFLAKRFAAKEAISKALGEGIGRYSFRDIEILNLKNGKPIVNIKQNSSAKIDISISDDYPTAIAFAIHKG